MPLVTPHYESMQYDGTNGEAVVDWLNGSVDLVSDDGTQLVVAFLGSQRTIEAGGWVIAGGNGAFRGFYAEQTATAYAAGWHELQP